MLEDYYVSLSIERPSRGKSTDPVTITTFGIDGFLQPVSTGFSNDFRNGKGGEKASHRLYSYVSTDLVYGDKVINDSQSYIVLYGIQPDGVSGVGHHKEFICGVFE